MKKEKLFKKVEFYGYLITTNGDEYKLLSPHPVTRDSWMSDHQQCWLVVNADDAFMQIIKVGDRRHTAHSQQPHHLITSYPTIELIMSEGYVWSGEWIDVDEAKPDDENDIQLYLTGEM